ncbi:hypothetical protein ANN_06245 [Periplaneta americana]|uniref:Uncharacterized protein n=1 Tax=Periplaneta americana TaxID=6978 RepID=A0ABQ8TES7_PERAM|nr:hypothetical protein ANN_06245 [Periplaneta americana]
MAGLLEAGNEPAVSLKAICNLGYLASELDEGDNASEMSPRSNAESYPAFAHIGLRENHGKTSTRSIFCGPLEKEPRKRLVKCFVCSMVEYDAWTLRRSEEKRLEAFQMWIWRRVEHVKWTDRIRCEAVLKRMVTKE